tara:strand:- start:380 stop:520 length:141 start_codon:yes stop_codon:yes gene_type:complete
MYLAMDMAPNMYPQPGSILSYLTKISLTPVVIYEINPILIYIKKGV